jgi:sugar O-acyltransferase (sialic acid O-acetyltransferase NeuD family)
MRKTPDEQYVIVGARGCGRETFDSIRLIPGFGSTIHVKGFLDDKADALDGMGDYPPILSSVEDYRVERQDRFLIALGEPIYRKKYAQIVMEKGGRFGRLINPKAIVYSTAVIGSGTMIGPFAIISSNVVLGSCCLVHGHVVVGHDVSVGDCSVLGAFTFLGGGVQLGNLVNVFTRATILPHKRIGDGAVIGAGSVVVRHVHEGSTVFGNPARRIDV